MPGLASGNVPPRKRRCVSPGTRLLGDKDARLQLFPPGHLFQAKMPLSTRQAARKDAVVRVLCARILFVGKPVYSVSIYPLLLTEDDEKKKKNKTNSTDAVDSVAMSAPKSVRVQVCIYPSIYVWLNRCGHTEPGLLFIDPSFDCMSARETAWFLREIPLALAYKYGGR